MAGCGGGKLRTYSMAEYLAAGFPPPPRSSLSAAELVEPVLLDNFIARGSSEQYIASKVCTYDRDLRYQLVAENRAKSGLSTYLLL